MNLEEIAASRWTHAIVAVGLTVFGVVASVIGSIPGILVGLNSLPGYVLAVVLSELGFAVVALGFVAVTGRGRSYLNLAVDVGLDLRRGWGFVAAVTAGMVVFRFAAVFGALAVGIEPSAPSITEVALPTRTLLLVLFPAMLLVVGPAEELLFRGVIQSYLRETFAPWPAIVGAGVLFASIHLLSIQVASPESAAVSLGVILVVGIALGWLFERTGSLPAAMLAHGGYNAVIVASAYALEVGVVG